MKKYLIFTFLFLFLSSYAQRDRRVGYVPQTNKSSKQKKVDPIKVALDYLKKELTLDTFQEAATKTFLEETQREKEFILSLDISTDDKISKMKKSLNKFDSQIKEILNNKQKDKFEILISKQKGYEKNKNENLEELENQ